MVFPNFFNLSLNFAIRSSWSEPQSAPGLGFCLLYRTSPFLAAKNIISLISVLTIWWCPCAESSLVLLEEGVCYDQCVLLAKLLAFALLHSVLQGQTCLYSWYFLTSYFHPWLHCSGTFNSFQFVALQIVLLLWTFYCGFDEHINALLGASLLAQW